MKKLSGEEFEVQREEITFTQLAGKHLKCNKCGERVTRSGVETHRNSHRPNKPRKVVQHVESTKNKVKSVTNDSWRRNWY
ncbi:hypothetical protein EOM39_03065 [Candidatus Gracilibacteria bacterium]|nr:hypothetical protein [Candidatus Gracilibacteria bacterium]